MTAGEREEVCKAWRATFGRFRSHHAHVYAHTHTHTHTHTGGGAQQQQGQRHPQAQQRPMAQPPQRGAPGYDDGQRNAYRVPAPGQPGTLVGCLLRV